VLMSMVEVGGDNVGYGCHVEETATSSIRLTYLMLIDEDGEGREGVFVEVKTEGNLPMSQNRKEDARWR
jgi:hypothetical protein